MPNLLRHIRIKNIKSKVDLEVTFDDLIANHVNILVAPNGFGKSTLATALKAASYGNKLVLKKSD